MLKNELLIIDPFVLSCWTLTYNLGQNGWKIKNTPPPISMMEKMAHFRCSASTSLNWGKGWFYFSFYSVQDCRVLGVATTAERWWWWWQWLLTNSPLRRIVMQQTKLKLWNLRWFPHNIRAIMAKIKLPKKSHAIVIFLIEVRRSYRDFSPQADPTREDCTWSYTCFK